MELPALYDYKNLYNSVVVDMPSTVHVKNTGLARFFKDYLYKKLVGNFDIEIPDEWDADYFQAVLFLNGYIAIFDEGAEYGILPQQCTLAGYNIFYRPSRAIITHPLLVGSRDLTIGVDCSLIKLTSNYKGVGDIIDYYGDLLALCAESLGINLINTHLAYVFGADGKNCAESFKKMYDRVASGDPAVVIDKSLFKDDGSPNWLTFTQNLSQTFIAPSILEAMNTIENQFDQLVGIPNANTDKRERMISTEVDSNNIDTRILADKIVETVSKGMEEANKMFGLNLSIRRKYTIDEEDESYESRSMDLNSGDGRTES